jgi:hypothetical protein
MLRQQERSSFTQAVSRAGDQNILQSCGRHLPHAPRISAIHCPLGAVIVENIFHNHSQIEFPRRILCPYNPLNASTRITPKSYLLIHPIYSLPLTTCQIGVSIRLNELPIAFWLDRVLAGVHSGDRSVNVAMRCRPSI